jgi:hypothetical protein
MRGVVMKWTLVLVPVLVGCSGPANPPMLGSEPARDLSGATGTDAGEDASEPEAASLQLYDASLASLPREGNVSCFGQAGQNQLEWVYQTSTSTALLLVQEREGSPAITGPSVSCALMTTLDADQCSASTSDSGTMITWNVSFNPTTNTFAGVRYPGMVTDGVFVTTATDFTGTCQGSWADL